MVRHPPIAEIPPQDSSQIPREGSSPNLLMDDLSAQGVEGIPHIKSDYGRILSLFALHFRKHPNLVIRLLGAPAFTKTTLVWRESTRFNAKPTVTTEGCAQP